MGHCKRCCFLLWHATQHMLNNTDNASMGDNNCVGTKRLQMFENLLMPVGETFSAFRFEIPTIRLS